MVASFFILTSDGYEEIVGEVNCNRALYRINGGLLDVSLF